MELLWQGLALPYWPLQPQEALHKHSNIGKSPMVSHCWRRPKTTSVWKQFETLDELQFYTLDSGMGVATINLKFWVQKFARVESFLWKQCPLRCASKLSAHGSCMHTYWRVLINMFICRISWQLLWGCLIKQMQWGSLWKLDCLNNV